MRITLYEIFCKDTLRHRETARKIVENIPKKPEPHQIIVDFERIEFASRSFLHELLSDLSDKKVEFVNMNKEVKTMMDVILRSSESTLRFPTGKSSELLVTRH